MKKNKLKFRINAIISISLIIQFILILGLQPTVTKSISQSDESVRRVNIPYLQELPFEPAIFWFGEVDLSHNYADVRAWYYEEYLIVVFHIIDRLHWVDPARSVANLTNWDAVSLYVSLSGHNGTAPTSNSYRLDVQLGDLQASYRGNGSAWQAVPFDFDVETIWRGAQGPNSGVDGKGWQVTYTIPFSSFGLLAKPSEGTVWGLGAILHDRDDANGLNLFHTPWPESVNPNSPSTWGQMHFGRAKYDPSSTVPVKEYNIRNGKDGATVVDAAVGGHTICGDNLDHWSEWGDANYTGYTQFNIQNQWDISDWPCFSKYYVTFPLDALAPGKAVISAALTMTLFGNSGGGQWGPPPDSYIQVLTVGEDWSEETLSWNNAPLARENISGTWVHPRDYSLPDQPYQWDVSKAVQQAYTTSQPLRLALYSIDGEMHSGKYFWTSDISDWNQESIPQLKVILGDLSPSTNLTTQASPFITTNGTIVTFIITWDGTGENLTLTSEVIMGFSAPSNLQFSSGSANYNTLDRHVEWSGTPLADQKVTLSYQARVIVDGPQALISTVSLFDGADLLESNNLAVFVDPLQIFLPLAQR